MHRFLLLYLFCVSVCFVSHAQDQTQQVPASAEQPQKVGPSIHAPAPLKFPEAEMPAQARGKSQVGICLVSLIVDTKGLPQNPHVIRCTDAMFEKNSLDAILKYRFKPAYRISDKTPVPVMVTIEVNFRLDSSSGLNDEPPTQIRYGFASPPGFTSGDPDADGTYPLSKRLDPPRMTYFVSSGFGRAAMLFPDGVSCKVVLVLDAKGKPLTASVSQCDKPTLEQPAIEALMKSKYKPARLNGQNVAVKMMVTVVYDGFGPRDTNHEAPPALP